MAHIFTLSCVLVALFCLVLGGYHHRDDDDHSYKHRDDDDHSYGYHDDDDKKLDFIKKVVVGIKDNTKQIKYTLGQVNSTVNTIDTTVNEIETDVTAILQTVNKIEGDTTQILSIVTAIEEVDKTIEDNLNKYFVFQGLSDKNIPQALCLPQQITKLDVNVELLEQEVNFIVQAMKAAGELPKHLEYDVMKQLGDAHDLLQHNKYSAACKCLVKAYDLAVKYQQDQPRDDDDDHKKDDDDHKKKDDDDHKKKDDDDHKKMDDDDDHKKN